MLNKIRAALSGGLLAALATLALPASAQVHQYVTGNEQTDSRLQIQISDGDYFRNYGEAIYYSTAFDLAQVTLRVQYNLRPARTRAVFINACDTSFSQYYGQATNNSFFEPQWQFAVKGADQRAFSAWYDLPATEPKGRDPCRLTFSPARIAAMKKLHAPTQTAHLRVRMKFGRVLSALWQSPVADFENIYSPEFDLTPPPSGTYSLSRPVVGDLTKITDQYLVTPQHHRFYTGRNAAAYVWGLVYKNPGNERLRYAASFPNFQYDSVNFNGFLSTAGTSNRLVVGQLYPETSQTLAFPTGVPLLPVNARPYLRVEAHAAAQPYGQSLKKVFMIPHVNRTPEFEYGYIAPDGTFKNISNCKISLAKCFTRNEDVFFAFKVKDPDLIHEISGGFYRGSLPDPQNRAKIGRNGFTVQITSAPAQLTTATEALVTTEYYLNFTFPYLTRIWNGIFFDIQVRDRLGGVHKHTYTLDVPPHPFGGIEIGYEAKNTGRPDVRGDGSGVIIGSHQAITFPGYERRTSNWYIGTTWIKTSPATAVTARLDLTPALATLAHQQNAPVRLESVYYKGTLAHTIVAAMTPVRIVLTGTIDGLYSGRGRAQVQAGANLPNWQNRVRSSELYNNARGDGQLESLQVAGATPHNISFNDWEPVYNRAGRFPPATAWKSPPVYQARMRIYQYNHIIALMESNLFTLQPPTAAAIGLMLTLYDSDGNRRATPGEVFEVNLPHRPAHAYFRGDLDWEFSATENFSHTITTITQPGAGVTGRYTLGSWPMPGPYFRARFTGQDKLSNSHTLTTAAWFLGTRPAVAATLRLQSDVFNATSVLTLDTAGVNAPDGGRFIEYGWEIDSPVVIPAPPSIPTSRGPTYTLNLDDFQRLKPEYKIRATAIYLDNYNHRTTVTARRTFTELATLGPAPTEIEFTLQPPASGGAGGLYSITLTRLVDANGPGTFTYTWQTRRGNSGAYLTLAVTTATYPLAAEDFATGAGAPEVRVGVTHWDATGTPATFYRSAGVPQHPAEGAVMLTATRWTAGSTISLALPPRDLNGIKNVHYAWGTEQAALRATTAGYVVHREDFNPARVLALTLRIEDLWGAWTTLTTAPLTLAQPPTGALTIYSRTGPLTLGAVLGVLTREIQDPNGGAVGNFQWRGAGAAGAGTEYTLTGPVLAALQAGQTLKVQATHHDDFGFSTTLHARYRWNDNPAARNRPVRGALGLDAPWSYTPHMTVTALVNDVTDENGIYQIDYFWRVNYSNRPAAPFVAGTSVWIRQPADWSPGGRAPQIELKVVVLDRLGYTENLHYQHQHQDRQPAALTLTAGHYQPGGRVTSTRAVEDYNGIRPATARHYWERGQKNFNTPERLTLTTAHYELAARDFSGSASWLRRVTEYEDWLGTPTTVRTAPFQINQPATGSIAVLVRDQRVLLGATVKVQAAGITDPNGGRLGKYYWELDTVPVTTGPELILTPPLYQSVHAGATLRVTMQLRDRFGWHTNFASTLDLSNLVLEQPTTGQPEITGPRHFNSGAEFNIDLTNVTDPNGRGKFTWVWQKTLDHGASWRTLGAPTGPLTLRVSGV